VGIIPPHGAFRTVTLGAGKKRSEPPVRKSLPCYALGFDPPDSIEDFAVMAESVKPACDREQPSSQSACHEPCPLQKTVSEEFAGPVSLPQCRGFVPDWIQETRNWPCYVSFRARRAAYYTRRSGASETPQKTQAMSRFRRRFSAGSKTAFRFWPEFPLAVFFVTACLFGLCWPD